MCHKLYLLPSPTQLKPRLLATQWTPPHPTHHSQASSRVSLGEETGARSPRACGKWFQRESYFLGPSEQCLRSDKQSPAPRTPLVPKCGGMLRIVVNAASNKPEGLTSGATHPTAETLRRKVHPCFPGLPIVSGRARRSRHL